MRLAPTILMAFLQSTVEKWMYDIFMSYGFRVRIIGYDEVAKNLGQTHVVGDSDCLLFVAEHLRYSDDEVRSYLIWISMQIM